jgi:hypothetical protein
MPSKRALTRTVAPDEQLPYFVLLGTHHDGYCLPLLCDGDVHFFATFEQAVQSAQINLLGGAYGYKVFDRRNDE